MILYHGTNQDFATIDLRCSHNYDIVYGPIANDKVGAQIRNVLEQNIDMETFLQRLKYFKGITYQYFFGSERSIQLLKRV